MLEESVTRLVVLQAWDSKSLSRQQESNLRSPGQSFHRVTDELFASSVN